MAAHHFEVATVDDLMHVAVDALSSDGTRIAPTKGACTEISATTFELTNSRARVSRSASRGRLFSALGELCWYLSGSSATEEIAHYAGYYRRFDEDGAIFGAYGPRLLAFDGVNQLNYVIETLRASPSSRKAVIQLFDHQDVIAPHLDVPCTCTLQYLLRDGQLSAITYMRSNDVFFGLPHDIFCFTMLQELIARSIGAEVGSYHHMVGSLHMYDENQDELAQFLREGWQSTTRSMPPMPPGDPWEAVAHLLDVERQLKAASDVSDVQFNTAPYWGDLERLLAVFAVRRGPLRIIEGIQAAMSSDYYNCYITERIDKRTGPDDD